MMDREKAYIPRLQIEFIDLITLPVYRKVLNKFYLLLNHFCVVDFHNDAKLRNYHELIQVLTN